MRVVATFHPPSGVEHSVKCSLTNDADLEHLVIAKSNRLDVYSVQPNGLKHECDLDIWGHIVSLRAIPSGPNVRAFISLIRGSGANCRIR